MATIREAYGIVRDDTIKLRDFPTLARVIQFVHDGRPELRATPASQATPAVIAPVVTPEQEVKAAQPVPKEISVESSDPVKERILALMVEKTGYPQEMLDLDLNLEADLGIDTVKQAEMFAAVRAAYNIPRDENMKLRDFPTLAHVIKFAQDRAGTITQASAAIADAPKAAITNEPQTTPV